MDWVLGTTKLEVSYSIIVGIAQGFSHGSFFNIRKSLNMLIFGYPFIVKALNPFKDAERNESNQ